MSICLIFSHIINSSALGMTCSPLENEKSMPFPISESRKKIEKIVESNDKLSPYILKWYGDRWVLHCYNRELNKIISYELNENIDKILKTSISQPLSKPIAVYPKNLPWKLVAKFESNEIPDLYEIIFERIDDKGTEYWMFIGKSKIMVFAISLDGTIRKHLDHNRSYKE